MLYLVVIISRMCCSPGGHYLKYNTAFSLAHQVRLFFLKVEPSRLKDETRKDMVGVPEGPEG